jgi:hypothetical protein
VASGFSRTSPHLFQPMPAVRYIPASDTSVLGNRVWVARNQPYGALITYYLPQKAASVELTIADGAGRVVQKFNGPAHAGVNRAVWNLAEASSCAPSAGPAPPAGRGRGGRGGGGGTWVRAIPGSYTVTLRVGATSLTRPVTVRMDPRVTATAGDMQAWLREARTIERTDCTLDRAIADLSALDRQVTELESRATDAAGRERLAAIRAGLRPVVLALRGDPRDPGHVNLPGRVNWLTIQVGNYSGRPTAAQSEWIAEYARQAEAAAAALAEMASRVEAARRAGELR